MLTGEVNYLSKLGCGGGFQATHIWGLCQEDHFTSRGFKRWIRKELGSLDSQRPISLV